MPSAFSYARADMAADVASVHEVVVSLEGLPTDNYATATVFGLLAKADTLLADAEVAAAVAPADMTALDTYRLYYHRDCCLVELERRMGDHTFALSEGVERAYFEEEWAQLSSWVGDYRTAAPTLDDKALDEQLAALYDRIRALSTREEVYAAWADRVDGVVRIQNDKLFVHVDELLSAVGAAPSVHPVFGVRTAEDSVNAWDEYVATYLLNADDLVAFWHGAVSVMLRSPRDVDQATLSAAWEGYDAVVAAVSGIVVHGDDVAIVTQKAMLRDYVATALQREPILSLSAADKQYYLDLAAQCETDLQNATTLKEVEFLISYYQPRFTFEDKKKKGSTTQWVLTGIAIGVALVCFAIYFILKRRTPTAKDTRKSAEEMMAELRALQGSAEQEGANSTQEANEETPATQEEDATAEQDGPTAAETTESTAVDTQEKSVGETQESAIADTQENSVVETQETAAEKQENDGGESTDNPKEGQDD